MFTSHSLGSPNQPQSQPDQVTRLNTPHDGCRNSPLFCLFSPTAHVLSVSAVMLLDGCCTRHDLPHPVLDVSGADMLAKSIANCQVELLENCGHSVVMERPRKTAKLIVDFLASVHNTDNNKKLD
ncbi:hypothetical protein P7K49_030923 [Saguinus oedipus]|uniref:acylglycerol lipase n=1 Tax=Saguinus oedipus TaxID=9490 RepID=A0ABQ9U3J0_SAGOE|nr:hypothetical protein P7K49_030923 [Saguinus oedipus]